ncbi:MAG: DUF1592 domain-containing protein [Planctomycetes bacterium]|nr:DUF1592 domain-containing protein [Planctomycetota bacterium]
MAFSRRIWATITLALMILIGVSGSAIAQDAPVPPKAAETPKVISEFLHKHCLACHGEKKQEAGLSLHSYRDELSVMKNRKVWEGVVKMLQIGEMPPEGRPRPAAAELEAFQKAVQDVFVRNSKPDPGRVTIRRLNRNEYNNTIRDLLGLDFSPAESFPADNVGYGFDNIGDVLSLSPILLERYLDAAQAIVDRVQLAPPTRRPTEKCSCVFLTPQGNDIVGGYRPLGPKNRKLVMNADPGYDGEYIIRGKVYATQLGDEPVKAVLSISGKELKTFEVKATTPKDAESFEVRVTLSMSEIRELMDRAEYFQRGKLLPTIAIGNELKNADGERKLWIEHLEFTLPADNRPSQMRQLFPADTGTAKEKPTRDWVARLATKAYRRPAAKEEVDRLVQLVEAAEKRGLKWEDAIRVAIQAVLVSPRFLFRVELDDRPDSDASHPIDEYQLASRLSYYLWSSMPDDELFDLAAKKQLSANLEAQVRRMLKDPKSKALVDHFAMQWLQMGRLQAFSPDPMLFPTFNERLRSAMRKETELFVEAVIREDRSILDLIDADFTFLNEPLAKHYGIADTNGNRVGKKTVKPGGKAIRGDQFVRVNLFDGERGGILTQASILTASSNPTRTSLVKRGHWVLEQILGTPPPPAPMNVAALEKTERAANETLRQQFVRHRADAGCANCHARIDPIGFAFENYDSIGVFRTHDGGALVDPSGTLPDGKSFKGPAELKSILKDKKELFSRCLADKMLTYALGRGVEFYDTPTLDKIAAALEKNDYKFSTLVTEIVRSEPFRLRRGKEVKK